MDLNSDTSLPQYVRYILIALGAAAAAATVYAAVRKDEPQLDVEVFAMPRNPVYTYNAPGLFPNRTSIASSAQQLASLHCGILINNYDMILKNRGPSSEQCKHAYNLYLNLVLLESRLAGSSTVYVMRVKNQGNLAATSVSIVEDKPVYIDVLRNGYYLDADNVTFDKGQYSIPDLNPNDELVVYIWSRDESPASFDDLGGYPQVIFSGNTAKYTYSRIVNFENIYLFSVFAKLSQFFLIASLVYLIHQFVSRAAK